MNRWAVIILTFFLAFGLGTGPAWSQSAGKEESSEEKTQALQAQEKQQDTRSKAIISAATGRIRWQPSPLSPVKFRMKKGDSAAILEKQEDWYHLLFEDDKTGWAHQSILLAAQSEVPPEGTLPKTAVSDPEPEKDTTPPPDEEAAKSKPVIKSDNDLISINFLNVDIREALSAFAMERELNIVTAQEVSGTVSLHLYEASLKKALDAITLAGGFAYIKKQDMYYIYKPKTAIDPQEQSFQMKVLKLKHSEVADIKLVLDDIKRFNKIKVHEPSQAIVVEDTPDNIRQIETIVNRLDSAPKQVMIEAKILEVTLTDDMTFGVDWNSIIGDIRGIRLGTGGFSSAVLPTNQPVSPVPDKGLFGNWLSAVGTQKQFAIALDFLQTKTKINTLSTPKILAIHGKPAKVQVGGQQGYRLTTTNVGVATESIAFIDTGTILEITAYIDDDANVLLNVKPEINSAELELGIPVVNSTVVETWLMAKDGETAFIGGLIQDSKNKTRDMIPCL
ncbi:secretin N-terminal domain-containing protein, partial [Thermodesulfobacteriota bacterium]